MEYETKYDAELKIWSGPEKTAEYLEFEGIDYEKSIGEQIFERMQSNSERICQVNKIEVYKTKINDSDGTILTHGKVLDFGIKIALYLRKLRLTKEDVVGIMVKNSTVVLPIAVGCWLNCTPFFPIYPQSDRKLIAHLFGLTKPKLVFTGAENYDELIEGCNLIKLSPKIFTTDEYIRGVSFLDELLLAETNLRNFQPTKLEDGSNQTTIYLCSSGTTGIPKCMHLSNSHVLAEYRPIDSDKIMFTFGNLAWITAVANAIIVLLSSCTSILTSASPEPELLFQLIPKYKINHIFVAPDLLAKMAKCFNDKPRDLTSVHSISCGGSVVTILIINQICEMLTDGFLHIVYGATEYGCAAHNVNFEKPKSVGKLVSGVRVKIVNSNGQSLSIGETGEILVHNGRSWRGYVGNAKETAAMQDADGWFHSGDLGYFDEDADLYIVDRIKDGLKFRGIYYSPTEIEHVIADMPDVIEVCVFGIQHEIDVDRSAAAIILKGNSQVTKYDVEQYVAAKLPFHLHLHGGVYFMNNFPKTSSGKIMRRHLRDMIVTQNNIIGDIKYENSEKIICKL